MISFPSSDFVKTKWPGYFYNQKDKQLYSIKSGVLKPLKLQKKWNTGYRTIDPGFDVSVNGKKHRATNNYLLDKYGKKDFDNQIVDHVLYYEPMKFVPRATNEATLSNLADALRTLYTLKKNKHPTVNEQIDYFDALKTTIRFYMNEYDYDNFMRQIEKEFS